MEGCCIYLLILVVMTILSVLLTRRSEEASKKIFYYCLSLGALGGILGIIVIDVFGTQAYAPAGVYLFVLLSGIIVTTFGTWFLAGFPSE
ncbi:MAG: hypothetical protein ACOCTN_03335 [Candidatus Natronoplasma sp.]